MTLNEFYDAVAKLADTDKTSITAAETRRVLATAFGVLAGLDAAAMADVVAKGLAKGKARAAKAQPATT